MENKKFKKKDRKNETKQLKVIQTDNVSNRKDIQ